MTLKAIETRYKGYRFRSRLEARWAVFFDTLGITWKYEQEGLDLGGDGLYLPDFWLADPECYVEIKPSFGGETWAKLEASAKAGTKVVALAGDPWPWGYVTSISDQPCGILRHYPSAALAYCCRGCDGIALVNSSVDGGTNFGELVRIKHGKKDCVHVWRWPKPGDAIEAGQPERIEEAYLAARSARFEHGECPQAQSKLLLKPDMPIGEYRVKFVGVAETRSEKYGAGIKWQFELLTPPHQGRLISRITDRDPTGTNSCGRILRGLLGRAPRCNEEVDVTAYIGREYRAVVQTNSTKSGTRVASISSPQGASDDLPY